MIKGKTTSGFVFEVEKAAMDDMELVELLASPEEELMKFPKIAEMILGEKQKKEFYDHLRDEKGRVPVAAVVDGIKEIFAAYGASVKK